ncbi:MAG: lysylphosphatidylglycerol synthase transmembrane domain-containing protein, partial [Candidatus Acidiferrales bacterium]
MTDEGPPMAGPRESTGEIASSARLARKVFWVLVRLAIAGGLLAYLARSGIIDVRALSRPFTAWPIALAAVALILSDVGLMALKFSWLFRPRGLCLPWGKSFQLTLVSFFFAQFLPGAAGGDIAKLFYAAKENKGRRSEIITVSLFDRAIGMLSLLLMPLLFAPAFAGLIRSTPGLQALLISSAVLAALLLAGFLACVFYQSLVERVAQALLAFLPWKDWPIEVIRTIAFYRHHLGTVAAALCISIAANFLNLIVMVLAVFALNPARLNLRMFLIVPLGFVANSLPFTPGGLGVGETAFNALFVVAGLTGGAEALLCWRVWTALVRLLGLVFYLRGIERVFGHHAASDRNPA